MKRNLILRRISQTPFCSKSTERNQKFTLSRCWQNCGVRKSNQLNTKRFIFFQQKQERLFRIGPCWYLILLHDTKDKTTDFFSLCFFPSMQSRGAYMQFDSWDLRHWYITVFHIHGQISQHCVCVFHLNSCARRARRSKIVDFSFVVSDCVKIFHIIAAKFVCLGILQLFCAAKIQENAKCISDKSAGNCGGGMLWDSVSPQLSSRPPHCHVWILVILVLWFWWRRREQSQWQKQLIFSGRFLEAASDFEIKRACWALCPLGIFFGWLHEHWPWSVISDFCVSA